MDDSLPHDNADLLNRIQSEWWVLLETMASLDERQLALAGEGQWTVKDHLAHLAAWEDYLLRHHFQGYPSEVVLETGRAAIESFDENVMNAVLQERNRHLTIQEITRRLEIAHAQVMAVLAEKEFDELLKPDPTDDIVSRPLLESIVYNTYEHYQEHLKTIRKIICIPC